ncbi:MAG: hypothetical protein GX960_09950 [Actinomycetales bacterium]|nr:hypothetical protein [Actinomycetales bacterium]
MVCLASAVDEQASRMHRDVQAPLIDSLTALGVEGPVATAELINAVVHAATLQLESGHDLDQVRALLASMLGPLVRELGGSGALP